MLTIQQTIGALAVLGLSVAIVASFLIYPPFGWKPAVAFFCCVYIPALILGLWPVKYDKTGKVEECK